jgi:hypothetical protein
VLIEIFNIHGYKKSKRESNFINNQYKDLKYRIKN